MCRSFHPCLTWKSHCLCGWILFQPFSDLIFLRLWYKSWKMGAATSSFSKLRPPHRQKSNWTWYLPNWKVHLMITTYWCCDENHNAQLSKQATRYKWRVFDPECDTIDTEIFLTLSRCKILMLIKNHLILLIINQLIVLINNQLLVLIIDQWSTTKF